MWFSLSAAPDKFFHTSHSNSLLTQFAARMLQKFSTKLIDLPEDHTGAYEAGALVGSTPTFPQHARS